MSEYNIKVSKLEDGSYKLKINNYSRYEVEEVEALAIKYLQKQIEQKDIKIKELSQWDTNKDTRNSRQRIANDKLKDQLQQKENLIKEVREYIEKNWISQKDADNYRFDDEELDIEISDIAVLFDILDKEVN